MANKRKYPEVVGYWVYSIKIPSNNKYYIGVSGMKECRYRWYKANYKSSSLALYLSEWDSMIKTVIQDGLTKEEALKMEDELIQSLSMKDLCINERRSGLIEANDRNAYMKEYNKQYYEDNKEQLIQYNKQWKENNSEYMKQYMKQYYENNKEKVRQQQRQYYENNKEKVRQQQRQYRLKKKQQQNNTLNTIQK